MSLSAHLTELKKRHSALSLTIESEQRSPGSNDLEITRLKREKLRLKEEINRLSTTA